MGERFYLEKKLSGFGWYVMSDGWCEAFCFTKWGAERVLARCQRNYKLNQANKVQGF